MPIVDSVKNRIISSLNENEIRQKAEEIRFYSNLSAGISGFEKFHGHNALINIAAILYFNYIIHDPMNPFWDKRDRVFWSDAGLAPLIYSTLGLCGYFPVENLVKYEETANRLDMFPDRFKIPGIEISVDCPGSGLGVAVGDALSAKMSGNSYKVFCIMSSSEQYRGSVWEAADSAYRHRLGNLIAVIENSCPEDDDSDDSCSELLSDKYESFGWEVYKADSRDPSHILEIFEECRNSYLPAAVIIDNYSSTDEDDSIMLSNEILKGKSVICKIPPPDMKNKSPEEGSSVKTDSAGFPCVSVFTEKYGWNKSDKMKTEFRSMEKVLSRFLMKSAGGKNGNYIFYSKGSGLQDLDKKGAGAENIIESEENIILTASGLAKEGLVPFIICGGSNCAVNSYDQLRNTVCLNNFNVKFIDLRGKSSDKSGSRQLFYSDNISAVQSIRNLRLFFPSDAAEAEKMISCAADIYGPVLIRIPCGSFPVLTKESTPFYKESANVIRYRGVQKKFSSAFDICPGPEYTDEKEDIAVIAFGRIVSEAMRSSYILREEYGIETRVINALSASPLDEKTIINAAFETGAVLAVCESSSDGFSDIVAAAFFKNAGCSFNFIFTCSGDSSLTDSENCRDCKKNSSGINAEFITEKALELLNKKNKPGG